MSFSCSNCGHLINKCICTTPSGSLESQNESLREDCIRLQQEINFLRMEPCQLPHCVEMKAKAEALAGAIQELELSKTSSHDWKGDRQKAVYHVKRTTLVNLFAALAAFKEPKG